MLQPSTQNLTALPDINTLKNLCKALAALDAIICPEWESRYYSYNKNWNTANGDAFFQMRDGSGDEFQILFSHHGAVINGFAHESEMSNWVKRTVAPATFKEKMRAWFGEKKVVSQQTIYPGVVEKVPGVFREFIDGEPVRSIGTTFCIWRLTTDNRWNIGDIQFPKSGDGSSELLSILDNNPQTYRQWAAEYYEEQFEDLPLKLETVKHLYDLKPVTRAVVKKLNPTPEDFNALKSNLDEIGYPYENL